MSVHYQNQNKPLFTEKKLIRDIKIFNKSLDTSNFYQNKSIIRNSIKEASFN